KILATKSSPNLRELLWWKRVAVENGQELRVRGAPPAGQGWIAGIGSAPRAGQVADPGSHTLERSSRGESLQNSLVGGGEEIALVSTRTFVAPIEPVIKLLPAGIGRSAKGDSLLQASQEPLPRRPPGLL